MSQETTFATNAISIIAIIISIISLYISLLRIGKLKYVFSQFTALGMDKVDENEKRKSGSTFLFNIEVANTGVNPKVVKDIFLIAKTEKGSSIIYEPILNFDLVHYIANPESKNLITESQKGQVKFPFSVEGNSIYRFPYHVLFLPRDKKTLVLNDGDYPITLEIYVKSRTYRLVSEQKFTKEDVKSVVNGTYAGVLTSAVIEERDKWLQKRRIIENHPTNHLT